MQRNNPQNTQDLLIRATGILQMVGLGQHYAVEQFRDGIVIKESSEHPPSKAQCDTFSEFALPQLQGVMQIEPTEELSETAYVCRPLQRENKNEMTPKMEHFEQDPSLKKHRGKSPELDQGTELTDLSPKRPVEKANKERQQLVFPLDAKFDNKMHPAIFTFSSRQEAKNAINHMIEKNPHLKQDLSKIEIKNNSICFTKKNCEAGHVKLLLNSFEFSDPQTKKAANYLAERTENTKEHYSDSRFKNRLPGAVSRTNKCNSAFKTLQKSFEPDKKLVHEEKNKNIPDSPKRTFK